jgi:AcrR family transcriptional regulator
MHKDATADRAGRTARDTVGTEVLDALERMLDADARFSSLSVQAICTQAGVSRSAFYVNFSDKTEVLLKLLERAMGEVAQVADSWLEGDPQLGLESLLAAQHNAFTVYRKHAPLLRAYNEVAAYDDEVAALWRQWLSEIISAFAKRIRSGQRSGVVRRELSPTTAARFIVLGSDRLLREETASTDGSADRRLAREVAYAIWALLHCPNGSPEPTG